MSFPPNDLTLNLMPAFLLVSQKSKERTGCQLVLPLPRIGHACAETPGGARTDPMGKRLYVNSDERCKPLVEVDLLAHEHPAFHPRLTYYNVSVIKLISLFEAI